MIERTGDSCALLPPNPPGLTQRALVRLFLVQIPKDAKATTTAVRPAAKVNTTILIGIVPSKRDYATRLTMFRLTKEQRVGDDTNMHRVFATALAAALAAAPSPSLAQPVTALPPAPAASVSFDAGMLHVDRYGSGAQSLVLIPGLASGPWTWYGTIAHFSPDYTVYSLSLSGFAGRPASTEPTTFAAFSADFWQMLAANRIDRPIVVGHSLGGTLAILLGEQHPDRLRGIVAVDGLPVFPALATQTAAQRGAMAAKAADQIAAESPQQLLAYERGFMRTIGTREAGLIEPMATLEARSDPKTVAGWLREDLSTDLRPGLNAIAVPLLEIMPYDPHGSMGYTQEQTLAFYQSLFSGTPNVRVVPVAPARHFAMLDQPAAFYRALSAFFATLK